MEACVKCGLLWVGLKSPKFGGELTKNSRKRENNRNKKLRFTFIVKQGLKFRRVRLISTARPAIVRDVKSKKG